MSKIELKNPNDTTGKQAEIFSQIHNTFGVIPNMFKAIGNSEAALESMWTSFGALSKGNLGTKLGEQIAVLVADINRCEYCLAAHTLLGQKAGATPQEMAAAQAGESSEERTQAALHFTKAIIQKKAGISTKDVEDIKKAGFTDGEIAEIMAHVALNIFTNYTNIAFDVPVDFPKVNLR